MKFPAFKNSATLNSRQFGRGRKDKKSIAVYGFIS